jgi:hypothetical protein
MNYIGEEKEATPSVLEGVAARSCITRRPVLPARVPGCLCCTGVSLYSRPTSHFQDTTICKLQPSVAALMLCVGGGMHQCSSAQHRGASDTVQQQRTACTRTSYHEHPWLPTQWGPPGQASDACYSTVCCTTRPHLVPLPAAAALQTARAGGCSAADSARGWVQRCRQRARLGAACKRASVRAGSTAVQLQSKSRAGPTCSISGAWRCLVMP